MLKLTACMHASIIVNQMIQKSFDTSIFIICKSIFFSLLHMVTLRSYKIKSMILQFALFVAMILSTSFLFWIVLFSSVTKETPKYMLVEVYIYITLSYLFIYLNTVRLFSFYINLPPQTVSVLLWVHSIMDI